VPAVVKSFVVPVVRDIFVIGTGSSATDSPRDSWNPRFRDKAIWTGIRQRPAQRPDDTLPLFANRLQDRKIVSFQRNSRKPANLTRISLISQTSQSTFCLLNQDVGRTDPEKFGLRIRRWPNDTPEQHPATLTPGTMPHDLPAARNASAALDEAAGPSRGKPFISADDFDRTGIFTGFDPSASAYWWMPELYGPMQDDPMPARDRFQAARPAASRSTAAA
jgi:hypothetical protein